MDPEVADIDLSDPELEKAATKIQATFKGFKARRQEKDAVVEAAVALESESGSSSATAAEEQAKGDAVVDETIDIDLTDPEVEKAATKIQATFKGFKARREVRGGGDNADQ